MALHHSPSSFYWTWFTFCYVSFVASVGKKRKSVTYFLVHLKNKFVAKWDTSTYLHRLKPKEKSFVFGVRKFVLVYKISLPLEVMTPTVSKWTCLLHRQSNLSATTFSFLWLLKWLFCSDYKIVCQCCATVMFGCPCMLTWTIQFSVRVRSRPAWRRGLTLPPPHPPTPSPPFPWRHWSPCTAGGARGVLGIPLGKVLVGGTLGHAWGSWCAWRRSAG